jgi:predicted TIM-barrel fold metal-dependent hydrolase
VKIISAENDIGWIPYWFDQADKYFERYRKVEPTPINKRPSEYFDGQLYATFFNEEFGGSLLGKWVGVDNCMWSNDYPHSGNMTWPYSREVIARDLSGLQPEDRAKLLRGNVARLYNLKIPNC